MPTMTIKPVFSFGDIVYHATDPRQEKGIVVSYEVHPKGIKYVVSYNGMMDSFYYFELSSTPGEVAPKQENDDDE